MKKHLMTLFIIMLIFQAGCSMQDQFHHHSIRTVGTVSKEYPSSNFIPKHMNVVSIGDSLTEGVGDTNKQGGYLPYLQTQLEALKGIKSADFDNYGKKGNRTEQLLKRLQKVEVQESIEQADIVIITIGGNDVMKVFRENINNLQLDVFQAEKEEYRIKLQQIFDTIKSYNADVGIILVGLYNPFNTWFSDITEVNEIIHSWNEVNIEVVGENNQALFVGIDDLFLDQGDALLYDDFFHPNDKGYQLMADRIFEKITNGETLSSLTEGNFIVDEKETSS